MVSQPRAPMAMNRGTRLMNFLMKTSWLGQRLDQISGQFLGMFRDQQREENNEHQEGQAVEDIDDAHHQAVCFSSRVTCNGAVGQADDDRDGGGYDANEQGYLPAKE